VLFRDVASASAGADRVIAAPASDARDAFGARLAVQGDIAAIAATGMDHGAGAVIVYSRSADGEWVEDGVLLSGPDNLAGVSGAERRCDADGRAVDLFDCRDVELLSLVTPSMLSMPGQGRGVRLNDVWGWTDPETRREYALIGRVDGTSFVDITDPVNPVLIGDLPQTPGGPPSPIWRDIKTYANHAFIVADAAGEHGMQVFDLTQLRRTGNEPVTFTPTTVYRSINSAHNVVINEASGFAYVVGASSGGETCGGGLHMVDIRDPRNPVFAGCFTHADPDRGGRGYTHDAQCVTYHGPDTRYADHEICIGSNERSLSIADVTDKTAPQPVSRVSYPNPAYTHQGWFTEDHRYYFVDDELDELSGSIDRTRTLVYDLTDLEDPRLQLEWSGTTSASDHNLYIRDNLMYQSNYRAGLRIVDVSDPDAPAEVAHFDTAPYLEDAPGFSGTWSNYPFFPSGTVIVTSVQEGLFILKKRDRPVS
jgi:choice-of-anchor B domain-containing protein